MGYLPFKNCPGAEFKFELDFSFIHQLAALEPSTLRHVALLIGSRKTALSELYTKASIQKLESAAQYCISVEVGKSITVKPLSEANYSGGYLY
jgi:hypothetical protein